eukprot:CAMPEP_0205923846 /NCGR_PEP_ID=MMETSP1325-20131115/16638_1 /ASSEMBLY_ACC=CAM_ASM_000708 /TAXON_ID=236786 /ORGANISM="Florenciella sp., Strain RCC1007" /LENGTH=35 /DNA_ID= /DNA_START= /DNA_END= /DNA_ORIENTATION=
MTTNSGTYDTAYNAWRFSSPSKFRKDDSRTAFDRE